MYDSTSFSASSISLASLGKVLRNWSATVRHCSRAAFAQETARSP